MTSSELPDSVLRYVIRTQEPAVILDDAPSKQKLFSADSYIVRKHARSVLCLPLIKQDQVGRRALRREQRGRVRFHAGPDCRAEGRLSSQAAISLENARLYAELIKENRDRQKAEDDLRLSEAALSEAQQISHTGSWRWKVGTGEVSWSAEHFRHLCVRSDGQRGRPTRHSWSGFTLKISVGLEQDIERVVREKIPVPT